MKLNPTSSVAMLALLGWAASKAWRQIKDRRTPLPPRRSIERWEGEGGGVPVTESRTAAQTSPLARE